MPDPVPVILLGRLAVDSRYEGMGLGTSLIREALLYSYNIASSIGASALVTEAIPESAKSFYL